MGARLRFTSFLVKLLLGEEHAKQLASISINIDDSPGWTGFGRSPHDRDFSDMQQTYIDALTAWRKNPLAWRAVQITTDYVVGPKISISSPDPHMQQFINEFWHHPQNRLDHRLETMCEELSRSGDLFPLLFRNPLDGMSYLRFLTKDEISEIETAAGDWEKELVYRQIDATTIETKRWYSPNHGRAKRARAIALHYAVNRPLGAQFGESDLVTVIPWLLRYSRMLEGRIRLHWAARAFLWFVTVPSSKVQAKQEEYQVPPEPGSVIVKDDGESWEIKTPNLRGTDAQHDMRAARNMIDAGTGYPPHWRGESSDVNLATAQAMQEPTERHLTRRQRYFVFVLEDIVYHAYQRAHQLYPQRWPELTERDYQKLFTAAVPDITRSDNQILASASKDLAAVLDQLENHYPESPTLRRLLLSLVLKFAGEPQEAEAIEAILQEAGPARPPKPGPPTIQQQPSSNGVHINEQ